MKTKHHLLHNPMKRTSKIILILIILCTCVGCDQATKEIARTHLTPAQPVHLIGDLFLFQYAENPGSFLGLGSNLPAAVRFWLLIILVGIVLSVTLGFLLLTNNLNVATVLTGSLIVGGGASNLLDRLFNNGLVTDFMNAGVGRIRTGVFNVADLMIMAGGIGMILWNLFFVHHATDQSEP